MNNKLQAKDLINVGIFTAIYIVVYMAVSIPLAMIPILYPVIIVATPTAVNIITGAIVIIFGLNYLGVLPSLRLSSRIGFAPMKMRVTKPLTFPSAFLFGIVFSAGWTPCISAFLGRHCFGLHSRGIWLRVCLCYLCFQWV